MAFVDHPAGSTNNGFMTPKASEMFRSRSCASLSLHRDPPRFIHKAHLTILEPGPIEESKPGNIQIFIRRKGNKRQKAMYELFNILLSVSA